MISRDAFAPRTARRACALVTVVAVVACGGGSDGSSSSAVTKSESVQSFTGTVSCDAIGGTPQSRAFDTRVIFDLPVHRGMAQEVSSAAAIQIGGLAGSYVPDTRSTLSATIPASSLFAGAVIDFKVAATPATGTYAETGRWTIGVDAKGKTTLRGDSTATLGPVANGWRAMCRWDLAEAQAPMGPVSYGSIETRYGTPPTNRPVAIAGPASPVPKDSSGGCGDAWGWVSDGLFIAAAIVAIPAGGPVIAAFITTGAVAGTMAGSSAGNACLDSQLAAMNQQLAVQAVQIQQIDNYLGVATNVLYQKFWQVEQQIANTSAYNWQQAVNGISPSGSSKGLFGSFMAPDGVGLWNNALQPAAGAPTDPTQLALNDTAFRNASAQVTPGSASFSGYLKQLSGTDVLLPAGAICTSTDCPLYVAPVSNSALIELYQDMFAALQADIDTYVQPGQTPGIPAPVNRNIVPLYDQYNTMLVKFWTQAVYAMQQALMMEWTVNQMNYFRATSTTATQLPQIGSWGAIAGTHYQYGNQSLEIETDRYNTAQKNLAKVYAARINQLYLNTLNYIVSDVPVSPQAYPNVPISYTFNGKTYTEKTAIDYSGQMGKGIIVQTGSGQGVQGPTPLSLLPLVATTEVTSGKALSSSAALYQFSGLKDAAACLTSQQAYTASTTGGTVQGWLQTPGACPSIFALADGSPLSYTCDSTGQNCKGSIYDGNTLQPYTSYQVSTKTTGGPMQLSAPLPNNLKFCDPTSPALTWDSRGPMLNCGNWYVPQYLANGFPRANVPAANTAQDFYDATRYVGAISYWESSTEGCSANLSFEGAKYPALTTLLGNWPLGTPSSCAAVIPSVLFSPNNSTVSPVLTNARLIDGNYYKRRTDQGCTIGWIGSGVGNVLPSGIPNGGGDTVQFGVRLPRADNPDNQSGGFFLPLSVRGACYSIGRNQAFSAVAVNIYPNYTPADLVTFYSSQTSFGDINISGYNCTTAASSQSVAPWDPVNVSLMTCTIADGTRYSIFTNLLSQAGFGLNFQVNNP